MYDVQAMHMLITQLKATGPLKNVGDILSPGLNVSLGAYNASHGVNSSKDTMKVREVI